MAQSDASESALALERCQRIVYLDLESTSVVREREAIPER